MMLLAANAAKDLSLVLNRPWDQSIAWMGAYLKNMAFTQTVMSEEISPIPLAAIALISNMPDIKNVPDKDLFAERFNECFRIMVKEELSKGGRSELYPEACMSNENVLLFDGFVYYGYPQYIDIRTISVSMCRPWKDFLQGLASKVCSELFCGWESVEWKSLSLLKPEQFRKIEAIMEGTYVPLYEMISPSPEPVVPDEPDDKTSEEAAEEQEQSDYTFDASDEYPLSANIIDDYSVDWKMPDKMLFLYNLPRHSGETGDRTYYCPSNMRFASFERMNRQQTDFYLCWRDEISKGIYSDSDYGYLRLLLSDVVENLHDERKCLSVLVNLTAAYGQSSNSVKKVLTRTCNDYAIITGQDPPADVTASERDFILSIKLGLAPIGKVTMSLMRKFRNVDMEKYIHPGLDYDGPLNRAIAALNSWCHKEYHRTLTERYCAKISEFERRIMPDIIHNWPGYRWFKTYSPSDGELGTILSGIIKMTVIEVNRAAKLKCPRMPSDIPEQEMEIISSALKGAVSISKRERLERIKSERMESIVIDRDAIADAEEDLETVKRLMTVEEEPEPETEAETVEKESEVTGWDGLAASLSEEQKEYLSACLEGNGRAYLKSIKGRMPGMEDSINSVSTDMIGDQIVDSGDVFDDYAEEVRRITS